ncbi:MAG: DUF418 domain-containing protein [Chloroflexi bacterium]|nr:DUF418 domain-containing protein [Chloroflexota bacterium]
MHTVQTSRYLEQSTPQASAARKTGSRIIGYDFARALAILGMILVNFKVVMNASEAGPDWLIWFAGLFEGRAAATFVVLAGVGLALLSRRAREAGDRESIAKNRQTLLKRAIFLLVVGLAYTPLWPADILHFYGVYLAIGAFLLMAPDRRLWRLAVVFTLVFVGLILVLDYEQAWDWDTLEYEDFWTPVGMVRHLFFNGFHPVFPWAGFLFVGMWLGRQNMTDPAFRKKVLWGGTGVMVVTESISAGLVSALKPHGDAEAIEALFGTHPMPPMPLYMLASTATALVVITLSIMLTERFAGAKWLEPFVSTGQLALTLYVAHVVIGMGTLETIGKLEDQSLTFALLSGAAFYGVTVWFAYWWRRRYQRGPLEWVMRRLTD